MTLSLSRIVGELERLYDVFADTFAKEPFEAWNRDELVNDKPVISIASKGRKRTVRQWYVPGVWTAVTDDILDAIVGPNDDGNTVQTKRAEIVIASETLRETPLVIASYLVRGMLAHNESLRGHHSNVPNESNYYREVWQYLAARVGCIAKVNEEQPSKGWSDFVVTERFENVVTPLLKPEVFDISRDATNGTKSTYRWRSWKCECSRFNKVHAGDAFDATCGRCKSKFVPTNGTLYTGEHDDCTVPFRHVHDNGKDVAA